MNADLTTWLLSVFAFALAMSATPGPNNAMAVASGASFGFARTVPHIVGVAIGFPAMIVAVALGAGDVLRVFPVLHLVLKWAGAAYLLWLAVKIATARPTLAADTTIRRGRPMTFIQAALFQWVNPKAWIIAISAISTYTTPDHPMLAQAAILALVFVVISFPSMGFWTLTGVGAARLLRTSRAIRLFNLAMAALLVASLLELLREA